MTDLFFYGTLRHVPLLELVMGGAADRLDISPATLPDHTVHEVQGQPFPMIQPHSGAMAAGVLVRGLTAGDLARLNYYEGGFSYDLRAMTLALDAGGTASAQVFFPEPGLWGAGALWSLDAWAAKWGALSVRAATEVMAQYGTLTAEQVVQRFTGIRLRAAAWLAAQDRPADPDRDLARDVVVHAHFYPYSNFFAAEEMDIQFRQYDGSMGPVLNRGGQILGQATTVLPYDPVQDAVLLVEQFRVPVFIGGDRAPWIWEPVSGLIDPGETPQQAAHREVMEEAGLHLSRLEPVAATYSSTGSSSEFVHIYIGLTDFEGRSSGGGLAAEGEDIHSKIISYGALMQGVDDGVYRDMPLVTTALWLARHRDRLRGVQRSTG